MTSGLSRDLPLAAAGRAARAWPFEEARKVVKRLETRGLAGAMVKEVLFETGYGPSGLPHIGTFGEVARTSWVRQAFEALSDVPTRLGAGCLSVTVIWVWVAASSVIGEGTAAHSMCQVAGT